MRRAAVCSCDISRASEWCALRSHLTPTPRINQTTRRTIHQTRRIMTDDFDSGVGMPDDELGGGSGLTDTGDVGAGAEEESGEPTGRPSGGARARKSGGAKTARKAAKRGSSGGARKAAKKGGTKKKAAKGAMKKGAAKKKAKGGKKKAR